MDVKMEIEATHTNLVELGLPSTIADLTNPTEEYILNLITQVLNKLNIDVAAIRKPTFEQLNLSLVEDNPEMISAINLSQVMSSICSKMFIKDFHLMDLLNPVPKKSRKAAKLLSNYLLYATNKMVEIEERLEETRIKHLQLQELRNQKNTLKETKNAQALRIGKALEFKEQLEKEIEKLKMRKGEIKKRREEAEENLKSVQQENIMVVQRHQSLATQAAKTRKEVEEINSKVVRSPERHNALLRDVIEQKNQLSEKRENIHEALKSRQPSIQQVENCLVIVRQIHAKLLEVNEAQKCYTESKKELELGMKKIDELKIIIKQESTAGTEENGQDNNAALQEAKDECEKHLSTLRKQQKQLLTEKKVLVKKVEDSKTRLQEILSKKDEIQTATTKKEAESRNYVKECQDLYDSEIRTVRDTRTEVEKTLEKNLERKH